MTSSEKSFGSADSSTSLSRTMILGKTPFIANLSSFTSSVDGGFCWSLRFQHQNIPTFAYQCTINQELFKQITSRYQFSSSKKFFDLIRECLFEGKGLKGLGYYFGEKKSRTPENGTLPLVLEVTVDLYSTMKFTLILDPQLHSIQQQQQQQQHYQQLLTQAAGRPNATATHNATALIGATPTGTMTSSLLNSLSPLTQSQASFAGGITQQSNTSLASLASELRQVKIEKDQEKERVHSLMREIDRLKTSIGDLQTEMKQVKKGVRTLETNELKRNSGPQKQKPQHPNRPNAAQFSSPHAYPPSQVPHQYPILNRGNVSGAINSSADFPRNYINKPQYSNSFMEFRRQQVPQQIRPHSMHPTELKAHLQQGIGVRSINNKTTIFSEWNRERTHSDLILMNNQKTVKYNGTGACVSSLGNVLYMDGKHEWIIRIDSMGKFGTILIGIADPNYDLNSKCGFTSSSYALSMQDGKIYHDKASRTFTNQKIETGSVVCVILDLMNQTLSFRINGDEAIVAYNNVTAPKVPCISLGEVQSQISLQSSGLSYN